MPAKYVYVLGHFRIISFTRVLEVIFDLVEHAQSNGIFTIANEEHFIWYHKNSDKFRYTSHTL